MAADRRPSLTMPRGSDAWWTIHGSELLAALQRVHAGEDPRLVFADLWSRADHEPAEESCNGTKP